jgi:histidine triad (HIT) family protein
MPGTGSAVGLELPAGHVATLQHMASIFTRIIDGEIPGVFVWRDPECVAFLSINPMHSGHTLVVPRVEVDHWIDLEPTLAGHLFQVAQTVGRAQQAALSPRRIGVIIAGDEVPHVHLHVVPFDSVAELSFKNADPDPPAGSLKAAAAKIRAALTELGADHVAE